MVIEQTTSPAFAGNIVFALTPQLFHFCFCTHTNPACNIIAFPLSLSLFSRKLFGFNPRGYYLSEYHHLTCIYRISYLQSLRDLKLGYLHQLHLSQYSVYHIYIYNIHVCAFGVLKVVIFVGGSDESNARIYMSRATLEHLCFPL